MRAPGRRHEPGARARAWLALAALLVLAGCPAASPAPVPPAGPDPQVEPEQPELLPVGAACLSGADCDSGVCEGQGCDVADRGECVPADRPCTRDLVPYCGCDGVTFQSSGTCPGQRYSHRGEC